MMAKNVAFRIVTMSIVKYGIRGYPQNVPIGGYFSGSTV